MKVLVADDSIFVRQVMKKYLLDICPELDLNFVASGEEGYDNYSSNKPDLIITDLLMPGMGGQAFIEKVRAHDKDTKIIVLSADIQTTVRQEIMQLGASAFINKPITRESVLQISQIIGA